MKSLETRLADLVQRYALPVSATEPLRVLLGLLADDPGASTAIRDPQAVLEGHLADALVALELEAVRGAATVADVGSGAGVPGLPLAIAKPTAGFALVESNQRKCAWRHGGLGRIGSSSLRRERWRHLRWWRSTPPHCCRREDGWSRGGGCETRLPKLPRRSRPASSGLLWSE
jgi:rRNA small subunit methyltransferase G